MSLTEIKEETRRMTPDERREIVIWIAQLDGHTTPSAQQAGSFTEAKNYVFENYQELLRRLADTPRIREVNPSDPGVKEAMDKVFSQHRELLRRLADS